jgi:hypothetical protein
MKVTREENTFKPITITLENQEEADALWHILNCGEGRSLNRYTEDKNIEYINKHRMWSTFNAAYQPKECDYAP